MNSDQIDALKIKLELLESNPGLEIEMEPEEAQYLGAFEENALSVDRALMSSFDRSKLEEEND